MSEQQMDAITSPEQTNTGQEALRLAIARQRFCALPCGCGDDPNPFECSWDARQLLGYLHEAGFEIVERK